MAKYRFHLQETFYHVYDIELPDDVQEGELEDCFYELSEEEQKKGLVSSESFTWEITEVEQV